MGRARARAAPTFPSSTRCSRSATARSSSVCSTPPPLPGPFARSSGARPPAHAPAFRDARVPASAPQDDRDRRGSLLYLGARTSRGRPRRERRRTRNFEMGLLTDDEWLLDQAQARFDRIGEVTNAPVAGSGGMPRAARRLGATGASRDARGARATRSAGAPSGTSAAPRIARLPAPGYLAPRSPSARRGPLLRGSSPKESGPRP